MRAYLNLAALLAKHKCEAATGAVAAAYTRLGMTPIAYIVTKGKPSLSPLAADSHDGDIAYSAIRPALSQALKPGSH